MNGSEVIEEIVALMERAAERAGKEILSTITLYSKQQRANSDVSTADLKHIDKRAEEILLEEIRRSRFGFLVISEESEIFQIGTKPEYVLVIDPLDGTNNALCGIPFFAVSLALAHRSENPTVDDLIAGVVWDINVQRSYVAIKGKGLLKAPLSFTGRRKGKPLISLYAYGEESLNSEIGEIMKFSLIRTLGAVSLEMCFLAQGKINAFVDVRNLTRIVDIAAGIVILKETGCLVGKPDGERLMNKLTERTGLSIVAAKERILYGKLTDIFKGNQP